MKESEFYVLARLMLGELLFLLALLHALSLRFR